MEMDVRHCVTAKSLLEGLVSVMSWHFCVHVHVFVYVPTKVCLYEGLIQQLTDLQVKVSLSPLVC